MNKGFLRILIVILIASLFFPHLTVLGAQNEPTHHTAKGKVISMEEYESEEKDSMEDAGYTLTSYKIEVEVTSGKFKGETVFVYHHMMNDPVYDIEVEVGTRVILDIQSEGDEVIEANIGDYERDTYFYLMAVLFLLMLLAVGRLKGLKTIVTLVFTLGLIFLVLIPGILKGYNSVFLTILVCTLTTLFTIPVVAGTSRKSYAAILGTILGVMAAGILAILVGRLARLTGLGTEEAKMLIYAPSNVELDFKGLLFSGIIIGALGAIMDIAMSIASSMEEIYSMNSSIGSKELIKSGMNVGRDVMGTMSNTLILAYTGTSIPLILVVVLYKIPFMKVLNLDMMATELIRALIGTIGLIVTIPLTALIYGYMIKIKK